MTTALYTTAAGFDRSAIMRNAWARIAKSKTEAEKHSMPQLVLSLSKALKAAWWEAKLQRKNAPVADWRGANPVAADRLAREVAWAEAA